MVLNGYSFGVLEAQKVFGQDKIIIARSINEGVNEVQTLHACEDGRIKYVPHGEQIKHVAYKNNVA